MAFKYISKIILLLKQQNIPSREPPKKNRSQLGNPTIRTEDGVIWKKRKHLQNIFMKS